MRARQQHDAAWNEEIEKRMQSLQTQEGQGMLSNLDSASLLMRLSAMKEYHARIAQGVERHAVCYILRLLMSVRDPSLELMLNYLVYGKWHLIHGQRRLATRS